MVAFCDSRILNCEAKDVRGLNTSEYTERHVLSTLIGHPSSPEPYRWRPEKWLDSNIFLNSCRPWIRLTRPQNPFGLRNSRLTYARNNGSRFAGQLLCCKVYPFSEDSKTHTKGGPRERGSTKASTSNPRSKSERWLIEESWCEKTTYYLPWRQVGQARDTSSGIVLSKNTAL